MTKTKKVAEPDMNRIIAEYEKDGWEFITATQTSAEHSIGGADVFCCRTFPATFMLFFKKNDQQHNDI